MENPSAREFETLFVNNPDLDTIRSHLSRFNPIKTMGMERMEIRHSAILGWLLDPQETHGFGDRFLRAFLAESLRSNDFDSGPTALDLSQADLMDAEIRREWRHIDLLVISRNNGWIFVIENKYDSGQHSDQLTRYMDAVTDLLLDGSELHHARGIYLSLNEDELDDPRYVPIQYSELCVLIEQSILGGQQPLKPEIETFIKHYLEVIKEATGMNRDNDEVREIEKLARQLYRDNKRVLDFVVEHGKTTDFALACEAIFGDNPDYPQEFDVAGQTLVYSAADNHAVSFLPKSWYEAFGEDEHWWHGVENWCAGFPLITWLRLLPKADGIGGQIRLHAEVGRLSDHAFRKSLIQAISDLKDINPDLRIGFQRGAANEGKKYSKFFKKSVFPVDDIHDHEKIAQAMQKALKSFKKEIDAVAEVLPQFMTHAKPDSSC